ncbi:hypothetical protein WSK_1412 [Novosphingobium sp. Rr 2-17]|uniref:DUF805 domain-containing protein n=1 Tax=Novosphingobium sp. Rr 2-17 TaxID=555793 RepID=UPI0002698B86|nr:DUF805 domain-containing protein [Novosphingobium sp. Rr 2-17]EIZ80045.1 hypothetical protein WSK_1412 [Novosphingobium sp. Rr 2-17]
MIEAIGFNFRNLLNFNGRDSRSTFWFYVLFLVIFYFGISFALSLVGGGMMAVNMVQDAQAGSTDQAVVMKGVGHSMSRLMAASMWFSAAMSILASLLLVASFARRLHDSDKPGWIAVVVIGLYLVSVAVTISMIGEFAGIFEKIDFSNPQASQQLMVAQQRSITLRGLLGYIPILAVIVFGVWPSSDGDNRYGPEPDHL